MKYWIFVIAGLSVLFNVPKANADHYHHAKPYPQPNKIEVAVIDEYGYRLPLYETEGGYRLKKSYVQALRGQEYSIEVRNNTARRVGFVVAVDGRNIITGRPSYLKSHEKMYILKPHERSTFRGFRSSKHTINRFYFTDEANSYAAAFGDHSAMGVIAVAAFYEKRPVHPPHSIGNKQHKRNGSTAARSQPGTGWGDTEYSPTKKVKFIAQKKPFAKHLIKYEWHRSLCEKGIIHCHQNSHSIGRSNRLWDNDQYAPPPRRYR